MHIFPARLLDFTSKKRYLKFKEKFLGQCQKFDITESEETILSTNKIIYNDQSYNGDNDYINYTYRNHYLVPSINNMKANWRKKFVRKAKTLYNKEDKAGFAMETKNTFREANKIIVRAEYLSLIEKIILKKSIVDFEEYIDSYIKNPLPELKDKIEFNWDKNTIVYFFDMLRKNNVISEMTDSDLGRVIDDRFLYRNNKGEYCVPSQSRKLFHAIGKNGTKSDNNPYNLLKDFFSNPDIFHV